MDPLISLHATPKGWLLNSVLAPYAGAFAAYLRRSRYSSGSKRRYLGAVAHLARWMTQNCLPVRLLDESAVERFLVGHVSRCDCPRPVIRTRNELRAACAHLLDILREEHVIAERPGETGHIADELGRYDDYMQRVQGLVEGTRSGRLRFVQRLLLRKFADGPVMIAKLLTMCGSSSHNNSTCEAPRPMPRRSPRRCELTFATERPVVTGYMG